MSLFISGSNRKHNSYNFLNKIKTDNDMLYSLNDLEIKYCLGCNACQKNEDNHCILKDDMDKIYQAISENDKIIIMCPIYMNQIPGILKNIFDRFNPYCASEKLKGKKIYLITVGQMSEEEQEEVCSAIDGWIRSVAEFLYFDFEHLYNFTSGDVLKIDDITKMYNEEKLNKIIENIKNKIK